MAAGIYQRLRIILFDNAANGNRTPSQIARSLLLGLSALEAKDVAIHPRKLRNAPARDFLTRD